MRIITPKVHAVIDYILVVFLWVSPTIFDIKEIQNIIYLVGLFHLVLSFFTNYPLGLVKAIPFPAHGWVEFFVGVLFMFSPWILGFSEEDSSKFYSVCVGTTILIFWIISNYKQMQADDYSSGKVES